MSLGLTMDHQVTNATLFKKETPDLSKTGAGDGAVSGYAQRRTKTGSIRPHLAIKVK